MNLPSLIPRLSGKSLGMGLESASQEIKNYALTWLHKNTTDYIGIFLRITVGWYPLDWHVHKLFHQCCRIELKYGK